MDANVKRFRTLSEVICRTRTANANSKTELFFILNTTEHPTFAAQDCGTHMKKYICIGEQRKMQSMSAFVGTSMSLACWHAIMQMARGGKAALAEHAVALPMIRCKTMPIFTKACQHGGRDIITSQLFLD